MCTDTAIWSPNVVFFRYDNSNLLADPANASVLTLPAVNYGQTLLKGEDVNKAETVMFRRMKIALSIFADKGSRHLILGAYGCGVFGNSPHKIAAWRKELLSEYSGYFDELVFAVLDRSEKREIFGAFRQEFK